METKNYLKRRLAQEMKFYLRILEKGFRGNPRETIATTLNKGMIKVRENFQLPNLKRTEGVKLWASLVLVS